MGYCLRNEKKERFNAPRTEKRRGQARASKRHELTLRLKTKEEKGGLTKQKIIAFTLCVLVPSCEELRN